jgi:hypothetical protein
MLIDAIAPVMHSAKMKKVTYSQCHFPSLYIHLPIPFSAHVELLYSYLEEEYEFTGNDNENGYWRN